MEEVWKDIPGYEGAYQASTTGRIRSIDRYGRHGKGFALKKGRVLKQATHSSGYMQVGLSRDGELRNFFAHVLVMLTFRGARPPGLDVCHEDGDKQNNMLKNLRYDTKAANAADKLRHGTNNEGDTNARAKLTAEEVLAIFKRCEAGECQLSIAADCQVNEITVNHIATGRTWSSVTGKQWRRAHAMVTPKIVAGIATLQASGSTLDQIAEILGISKATAFRHSKNKSKLEGALCS